jgi:hypothetical protein
MKEKNINLKNKEIIPNDYSNISYVFSSNNEMSSNGGIENNQQNNKNNYKIMSNYSDTNA